MRNRFFLIGVLLVSLLAPSFASAGGTYITTNPNSYTDAVLECNVSGEGDVTTNGSIVADTNTLTLASTAGWRNGMGVAIAGAGLNGDELVCAKSTLSGSVLTLLNADGTACNASTTVSDATVYHDDTYAIQSCIDNHAVVHFREGQYNITSTIVISGDNKTIFGDNRSRTSGSPMYSSGTRFINRRANNDVFWVKNSAGNPVYNTTIRDLSVWQDEGVPATGGAAFRLGDTYYDYAMECLISNVTAYLTYEGLRVDSAQSCTVTNSSFRGIKYGLHLKTKIPHGANKYSHLSLDAYAGTPYTTGDTTNGIALFVEGTDADVMSDINCSNAVIGAKFERSTETYEVAPGDTWTYEVNAITIDNLVIERIYQNGTFPGYGLYVGEIMDPTYGGKQGVQITGGHLAASNALESTYIGSARQVSIMNFVFLPSQDVAANPNIIVVDGADTVSFNDCLIYGSVDIRNQTQASIIGGVIDGNLTGDYPVYVSPATFITGSVTPETISHVLADSGYLYVSNQSGFGGVVSSAISSIGTTHSAAFVGRRARGTFGAEEAVQDADNLVLFDAQGYTGSGYSRAADILFKAAGPFSPASSPGEILFKTTSAGSTTAQERAAIRSDGTFEVMNDFVGPFFQFSTGDDSLRLSEDAAYPYAAFQTAGGANVFGLILGERARGTLAAPASVQADDALFAIDGRGFCAATVSYQPAARILFKADGDFGYDSPGKILFQTVSDGSVTLSDRMIIDNSGNITITNLAGTYTNGSAYVCVDDSGVLYTSETGCP